MKSHELLTDSLSKFTLFETKGRFYITATSTASPNSHRVLKIDRAAHNATSPEDPPDIRESVTEDGTSYDAAQLDTLLRMVQDGNKGQGGLEKVLDFHGIVGFVRFTAGWYVILVTKRSVVGLLGGHYIFHCDETLLLTIANKAERTAQETKLLNTFQQVDLSKNFYYSYTYDLTNTLQTNLTMPNPLGHHEGVRRFNTRFMWNHHLLTPAFGLEGGDISGWVLPIIHGFVDQAKINVYSRTVYTTLIARRSRHFAGARYLKRGVNDQGHVANEVETEQIVSEPMITSFGFHNRHESDGDEPVINDPPTLSTPRGGYGNYTSFVQYRGSIPLIWTQDLTQMTPRPPIEISLVDPFYTAAAKHFDDLLGRYGAPLFVLNLIKCKEPVPRESKLLNEYGQCVQYLNQFLPEDKKMRYVAWDMARATKNKDQDVIGVLEDIAEESIQLTKFFHGGPARHDDHPGYRDSPQLQNGITRTNCVDCLDRTNAAQFAIGKKAFGHQLYALGILKSPDLAFDSDVVDMLTEMYHDHGDTLAWQYTGSALVNRMDTYRRTKTGQWTSHSRDLLENIRRFYANSMLDADKQAAINLFLGVDTFHPIGPQLPRHYQQWYNPNHLRNDEVEQALLVPAQDVFREYYKPHILSQFQRLYAFTMNSTAKFASQPKNQYLYSPFQPRIAAPPKRNLGVRRWMSYSGAPPTISNKAKVPLTVTPRLETAPAVTVDPQSVEGIVRDLLDLSSSEAKEAEYEWYTHYHADDLLSSTTLGEPQDLLLYRKAAQLFAGEGVEALLATSSEAQAQAASLLKEEQTSTADSELQPPQRTARNYEPASVNVQLYEHWLRTC